MNSQDQAKVVFCGFLTGMALFALLAWFGMGALFALVLGVCGGVGVWAVSHTWQSVQAGAVTGMVLTTALVLFWAVARSDRAVQTQPPAQSSQSAQQGQAVTQPPVVEQETALMRWTNRVLVVVLIVLIVLSAFFVRGIRTEEGQYRSFLKLGKLFYELIQSSEYVLVKENGRSTLVEMKKATKKEFEQGGGFGAWRIYGGFVLYIKMLVVPQDPIGLGTDQGEFIEDQVETTEKDPDANVCKLQHIGVGLKVLYGWRVKHPVIFQFYAPDEDPNLKVQKAVFPPLRGWTYARSLAQVQAGKGNNGDLWKDLMDPNREPKGLSCRDAFRQVEETFGREIIENSISIADVILPEALQGAQQQRIQDELNAGAELRKQEIGAQTFAAQTSGAEIAMLAKWTGKTIGELQTELQAAIAKDPANGFSDWLKKYPVIEKDWNLIQQKTLGVKPVLVGSATGGQVDPMTYLIALVQSLRGGGGGPGGAYSTQDKKALDELDRLEKDLGSQGLKDL